MIGSSAFVQLTISQPHLINTHDITHQPKTADNLLELVLKELYFARDELQLTVTAWCTDASGESAKMCRMLVLKCPSMVSLDCWSHQVRYLPVSRIH